MRYYESNACKSGAHCRTCRALDANGARFRASALEKYPELEMVQFPCTPRNLPWGPLPVDEESLKEGPCCH